MTGRELMEWLAEQPAEVLDMTVQVPDDKAEMRYTLLGLHPVGDGCLYVIDGRGLAWGNREE